MKLNQAEPNQSQHHYKLQHLLSPAQPPACSEKYIRAIRGKAKIQANR